MSGRNPWARRSLRRGARPAAAHRGSGAKRPAAAVKADDLEELKKAVDNAASVGGGLWFSYLFVMFYLAVASGAVTHADLFFERPVKLPFLNIELPLLAFFALAPYLFLVVHVYTLLHLVMLSEKAKTYDRALHEQIGERDAVSETDKLGRKKIRDGLREQLPSNVFVQFLAGPPKMRDGAFGIALRGVAWLTLVAGPVLLLLLLQLQFLPYHSSPITRAHRIALILDLGFIWWLWRKILFWGEGDDKHWFANWNWSATGAVASGIAAVFSVAIATYRGEPSAGWFGLGPVHDAIFDSEVDSVSGRRSLPFSDTLVLSNMIALDELGVDDPKKMEWRDFVFRARGRHLEGAIFDHANMARIDFEGAHLEGAKMNYAQLARASFYDAEMQGSIFDDAQLQGALLPSAQLQGASFGNAQMQGASLRQAQLDGASLRDAQMQGVSLEGARLRGAWLDGARLEGASLIKAHLEGAWLNFADFQGASLRIAFLEGASLDDAHLEGASLEGAWLDGASLAHAQLQGVSLEGARLVSTDLTDSALWRSSGRPRDAGNVRFILDTLALGPTYAVITDIDEYTPFRWTQWHYESLKKDMEQIPPGKLRDQALERIATLDCSNVALASCEPLSAWVPPLPMPASDFVLKKNLLRARAEGEDAFHKGLANTLRDFACSGSGAVPATIMGPGFRDALERAGDAAGDLLDALLDPTGKACPVAAALSDDDRNHLRALVAEAKLEPSVDVSASLFYIPATSNARWTAERRPAFMAFAMRIRLERNI